MRKLIYFHKVKNMHFSYILYAVTNAMQTMSYIKVNERTDIFKKGLKHAFLTYIYTVTKAIQTISYIKVTQGIHE